QAGRANARDSITGADDLFGELDRMAEKIEGTDAQAKAAEAMSEESYADNYGPGSSRFDAREFDEELNEGKREASLDEKLDELKRRMNDS
ncbi:MAG: hypothetical protein ACR2QM_20505, partial [Longimicrobiales bacterium]